MNTRDKERLEQLKNGNGKYEQKGQSRQSAEGAANNVQERLADARGKFKNAVKAEIVGGGISDALLEIEAGNFGEVGNECFSALDTFIGEVQSGYQILREAEIDPKYSLPSASFPAERTIEVEVASAN